MASSATTRGRLEKQGSGENENTWGDKANVVFDLVDEWIGGYLSKSVAGSDNVTLTETNYVSDESRQSVIEFTGALTGSINVIVPTAENIWWFINSTTGDYTLTVKTSAGTGIAITQGSKVCLYCDGTNVENMLSNLDLDNLTILDVADDSAAGPDLILHRNSASPADADFIGRIFFDGEDDGDNQTSYASIEVQIDDVTGGTEDGTLLIKTMQAGSLTTVFDLSSAGVVTTLGGSLTGTWSDLGTVTTVDINGGTLDGVTIGASSAAAGTFAAIVGTTITGSGVLSIDDTTDTSSGTTGSIHTDGGLGVAKDIYGAATITAVTALKADTISEITGANGVVVDSVTLKDGALIATADSFIGETANTDTTLGLTINQAGADDDILSFKSSDTAHGITTQTETDTYAFFKKAQDANSGLSLVAIGEGWQALNFSPIAITEVTTDTSESSGAMTVRASLKSGTSLTSFQDTANLISFSNNGTTRWLIKGDGDVHQTTDAHTALDEHDDVSALRTLDVILSPETVVRTSFDEWLVSNRGMLEDIGLLGKVTPEEKARGVKPLINTTRLAQLHTGAICQMRVMIEEMKSVANEMLPGFTAQLNRRLTEQQLPLVSI